MGEVLFLDSDKSLSYSFVIRKDGSYIVGNEADDHETYFDRLTSIFDGQTGDAAAYIEPLTAAMNAGEDYSVILKNGLMNGYGNNRFDPNDNLSRARLAQIFFNKEGRPVVNYLMTFYAVAGGAWYTEVIRRATSQAIADGCGNGRFGSQGQTTRAQAAQMLKTSLKTRRNTLEKSSNHFCAGLLCGSGGLQPAHPAPERRTHAGTFQHRKSSPRGGNHRTGTPGRSLR